MVPPLCWLVARRGPEPIVPRSMIERLDIDHVDASNVYAFGIVCSRGQVAGTPAVYAGLVFAHIEDLTPYELSQLLTIMEYLEMNDLVPSLDYTDLMREEAVITITGLDVDRMLRLIEELVNMPDNVVIALRRYPAYREVVPIILDALG